MKSSISLTFGDSCVILYPRGSRLQEMALRLATEKQTRLQFYAVVNDRREFPSSKNNLHGTISLFFFVWVNIQKIN